MWEVAGGDAGMWERVSCVYLGTVGGVGWGWKKIRFDLAVVFSRWFLRRVFFGFDFV